MVEATLKILRERMELHLANAGGDSEPYRFEAFRDVTREMVAEWDAELKAVLEV